MAFIKKETRLNQDEFDMILDGLVGYFRFRGLNRDISERYYRAVRYYPPRAMREACLQLIEDHKPQSNNFPSPKQLAHHCALWLDNHPAVKRDIMEFDHEEDLEFPLQDMWEAYRILCNRGEQSMFGYCQKVRMPNRDINRIRDKWRYQSGDPAIVNAAKDAKAKIRGMLNKKAGAKNPG